MASTLGSSQECVRKGRGVPRKRSNRAMLRGSKCSEPAQRACERPRHSETEAQTGYAARRPAERRLPALARPFAATRLENLRRGSAQTCACSPRVGAGRRGTSPHRETLQGRTRRAQRCNAPSTSAVTFRHHRHRYALTRLGRPAPSARGREAMPPHRLRTRAQHASPRHPHFPAPVNIVPVLGLRPRAAPRPRAPLPDASGARMPTRARRTTFPLAPRYARTSKALSTHWRECGFGGEERHHRWILVRRRRDCRCTNIQRIHPCFAQTAALGETIAALGGVPASPNQLFRPQSWRRRSTPEVS